MSELKTAVICGASGYIGGYLRRSLESGDVDVRTIGRGDSNDASWSDAQGLVDVLEGTDLVVNLAGRSVSCRYNKRNADQIFSSRVETTSALGRAIAGTAKPPSLWANASTGTIYRDARDHAMDEASGQLGSGFSVAVARAWEHELFAAPTPVRKVALRMSIVLGAGGRAINPFINLVRLGFGGRMGGGDQMFSWAHVDDVVGAIGHLFDHREISGPVNIASPHPVSNEQLMSQVREAFGRSRGVPLSRSVLELGARVIRTETELVLKSRWLDPAVLLDSGYVFRHRTLDSALAEIAGETPRGLLPVALG